MNKKIMNFEHKNHSLMNGEFKILVHSRDGWHETLRVLESEMIVNLKKKLRQKKDFSNGFILAFQGVVLDDDKTVGEYLIGDGSMIDIVEGRRQGYKIYCETADGKTCDLEVDGTETVDITKNVICEKFKLVPAEEQILWFEGALLHHDDMTLDECGLGPHSKLFVLTRFRGSGEIFIRTANGERFTVAVDEKETIASVKMKVQEKIGLVPKEQILVFRGAILEDDRTFNECGIGQNSMVNVIARLRGGMQISFRTLDGRTDYIEVGKNETIFSIKMKVHEKIGLAPDEQTLIFQGRELDDARTIGEYQIAEQCTINVVPRLRGGMQIFIRTMDGRTFATELWAHMTVLGLKSQIQEKIGISPEEQKLVFGGAILNDDSRILRECGICEKSVINLVHCLRLGIFIKTMDGKQYAIEVVGGESVCQLKKKIQDKLGISPEEQRLEFDGAILDDDSRLLRECGIKQNSIINILMHSE